MDNWHTDGAPSFLPGAGQVDVRGDAVFVPNDREGRIKDPDEDRDLDFVRILSADSLCDEVSDRVISVDPCAGQAAEFGQACPQMEDIADDFGQAGRGTPTTGFPRSRGSGSSRRRRDER